MFALTASLYPSRSFLVKEFACSKTKAKQIIVSVYGDSVIWMVEYRDIWVYNYIYLTLLLDSKLQQWYHEEFPNTYATRYANTEHAMVISP